MSRYKVVSAWELNPENEPFVAWEVDDEGFDVATVIATQTADIQDSQGGRVYRDGAHRVVTTKLVDGLDFDDVKTWKPIKTGKGGTVPFYGEMAWADAARLFSDEVFAARRKSSW